MIDKIIEELEMQNRNAEDCMLSGETIDYLIKIVKKYENDGWV
jgi:hypothetical protein